MPLPMMLNGEAGAVVNDDDLTQAIIVTPAAALKSIFGDDRGAPMHAVPSYSYAEPIFPPVSWAPLLTRSRLFGPESFVSPSKRHQPTRPLAGGGGACVALHTFC